MVKLVRTEKISSGTRDYTFNDVDADFIILHCYSSIFTSGSSSSAINFNEYTIRCCKGYSAGAYSPTGRTNDNEPNDTTVTFSGSTVTVNNNAVNVYITVEFYKYQ